MATLYVSYIGAVANHVASGGYSSETITTSGTSAKGGDIPDTADAVSVYCADTGHYVTIGTSPIASAANSIYVPAGTVRELNIPANLTGSPRQVAAITG